MQDLQKQREIVKLAVQRLRKGVRIPRIRTLVLVALPAICLLPLFVVVPVLFQFYAVERPADEVGSVVDTQPPDAGAPRSQMADTTLLEASFLKARLSTARSNALALSLDLRNNLLRVEISGITLRACPVTGAHVSRSMRAYLGAAPELPFVLKQTVATIPKVPVRIVAAPRDTAEANSRPPQEFPKETRSPYLVLSLTDGTHLHVRPVEASIGSRIAGSLLELRERSRLAIRTAAWFVGAGELPADKWIRIELSAEDVRAVYRAIPDGALVAIRR